VNNAEVHQDDDGAVHVFVFIAGPGLINSTFEDVVSLRAASDACALPEQIYMHFVVDKTNTVVFEVWMRAFNEARPSRTRVCGVMHSFEHVCSTSRLKVDPALLLAEEEESAEGLTNRLLARCRADISNLHSYLQSDMAVLIDPPPKKVLLSDRPWSPLFNSLPAVMEHFDWFQPPQRVGIFTHWDIPTLSFDSVSLDNAESMLIHRLGFEACTCVQPASLPPGILGRCRVGEQPLMLLHFDDALGSQKYELKDNLNEYSSILEYIWKRNPSETRLGEFIGSLWRASPSLFYSVGGNVYGDLWAIPRPWAKGATVSNYNHSSGGAPHPPVGVIEWRSSSQRSFLRSSTVMINFVDDLSNLSNLMKYEAALITNKKLYIDDIVPSLDRGSDPRVLIADNGLFGLCAAARLTEFGYNNFAWLQRFHEAPAAGAAEDISRTGGRALWSDGRAAPGEGGAEESSSLWWESDFADSPFDYALMGAFVRPIESERSPVDYLFDRMLDRIVPQSDWDYDYFEELIWYPPNASVCGSRDTWKKYYMKVFALSTDEDISIYAPKLPSDVPSMVDKCLVQRNQIRRTSKYDPKSLWNNLYVSLQSSRILHRQADLTVDTIDISGRSADLGRSHTQSIAFDVVLRSGHIERFSSVIREPDAPGASANQSLKNRISKFKLGRKHLQRTEHTVSFLVAAPPPIRYFYRDIRDVSVSTFDAPQYIRLLFPDEDRIFYSIDIDLRPASSAPTAPIFASFDASGSGESAADADVTLFRITARLSSALGRVHVPEDADSLREAVLSSLQGLDLFPQHGVISDHIVYNYSIVREVLLNSVVPGGDFMSSQSLQRDVDGILLDHGIFFDTTESTVSQSDPRFAEASCTAGIRSVDRLMALERRSGPEVEEGNQEGYVSVPTGETDAIAATHPSLVNCSKDAIKTRSFDGHCESSVHLKRAASSFHFELTSGRVYSLEAPLSTSVLIAPSSARSRFLARMAHLSCRRVRSRSRYLDLIDAARRDMMASIEEDEAGALAFVEFVSNTSLWSHYELQIYEVIEDHAVNCSLPSNVFLTDVSEWVHDLALNKSWNVFSNILDARSASALLAPQEAVSYLNPSTAALLSHLRYIADNYDALPSYLYLSESNLPSDYWFLDSPLKDRHKGDEKTAAADRLLDSGRLAAQLSAGLELVAYADIFVAIDLGPSAPFKHGVSLLYDVVGGSEFDADAAAINAISIWQRSCNTTSSNQMNDFSIFCSAKPFYSIVSSSLVRSRPRLYWSALYRAVADAVTRREAPDPSASGYLELGGGLMLAVLIEIARRETFQLYPLLSETSRYGRGLKAVEQIFATPVEIKHFEAPVTSLDDAFYLRDSRLSVYLYTLPPSMHNMWFDVVNRILCWLDRTWESRTCSAVLSPTRSSWPVQSVTCGDRAGTEENTRRTVKACRVNPLPESTLELFKASYHLTTFRATDASGDVIALMRLLFSLNHVTLVSDPGRADLIITPFPASFVSFMSRNLNSKPKLCDGTDSCEVFL
jgi:hypothetical protein